MIAHNENANSHAVRGAVRHGEALLAGLLRCGHCGAKMLAQYPRQRVIRYQCSGYMLNRDQPSCVMFGGLRADRLVSEQLLRWTSHETYRAYGTIRITRRSTRSACSASR